MKLITTRVNCRGCQKGAIIKCQAPGYFRTAFAPFECERCGSQCLAEIKRHWFKNKIDIRVKMVQHTKTLLNLLNKRGARA